MLTCKNALKALAVGTATHIFYKDHENNRFTHKMPLLTRVLSKKIEGAMGIQCDFNTLKTRFIPLQMIGFGSASLVAECADYINKEGEGDSRR